MTKPESAGKPFDISKRDVWGAYLKVKGNQGAPGVDGQTLADFEKDLAGNLYKIWNRMSSGSYFPPPVRAVEIPKPHGGGTRTLGVPTVADRVAQTVVARHLEGKLEPIFHPDSYGYRPNRSALDAVAACRRRCWRYDWVIDLDIQAFFDTVPWDLVVKAVEVHTDVPWVLLYVQRWLAAPLQQPDGTLTARHRGTPQGSAATPPTHWATSSSMSRWVTEGWSGRGVPRVVSDMTSSIFLSCLLLGVVLMLGSTPGGSTRPRSCSRPGWRWPRPRGCWRIGSAVRRGRRGGMSSAPRRTGRQRSRRPRRCSPCGCRLRWRPGCGSGLGSRGARSPPWWCRR